MRKTAAALFPDDPAEQADFLAALLEPEERGTAIAKVRAGSLEEIATVPRESLPQWLPESIEVLGTGAKPGNTEAYRDGRIYPLDFSSVLAGSAMLAAREALGEAPRVLDLCAAPGGKSILASLWLSPSLLLANEVEGKRLGMLRHNLGRCRIEQAWTQRLRPADWAERAPAAFDLVLVDAPCSGQSLLAKGIENPGAFHPATVKGNARRQLGILSAIAPAIRPGGFVLYTTCTFSERENEGVIAKWMERTGEFTAIEVPHLAEHRTTLASFPAYRFYPHQRGGAGGFSCLLRRDGEGKPNDLDDSLLGYPIDSSPSSAPPPSGEEAP